MSHDPARTQSLLESQFQVESVLPIPTPQGSEGEWYRYVITQGGSKENAITGTRSGNLSEIHRQLAEMVERLNERLGKIEAKKKFR